MSEINLPKMPEIKFQKNGYEIRSDILHMAKDFVEAGFHARYLGWETSVERDKETGRILTRVEMPEFPGLDLVLATAEKMYEFVNAGNKK